jgi:phage tail-like protein
MAAKRERPFAQFNFLVDLGTGSTDGVEAGFQECSNVGTEITVFEYRNGNEKDNSVRKLTGLAKATDVTLKRGIVGSANLYEWLADVRAGNENSLRTVRISLMSEDRTQTVQTWTLQRARIVKYVSGPFNAKGSDVALEELTLAYERMDMDV